MALRESYAVCEDIARKQAANFYPAFRLLPAEQRRGMCALYAFLRIADDLSDEPAELEAKRQSLHSWRLGLRNAMCGQPSHPIHLALEHTVRRFAIPVEYLEAAVTGVEMDLVPVCYETFKELRTYCYHVASVVGLSCIHIWGFSDVHAKQLAESAGIALQLTNILRDLREDAARGRVYLPVEDLRRFDYSEHQLANAVHNENFRKLMRFQVERAREFYEASKPLAHLLQPPGRATFLVLSRTYRAILDAIEKCDYDVFSRRIRLSGWRKLYYALSAFPVRWGWFTPAPVISSPS